MSRSQGKQPRIKKQTMQSEARQLSDIKETLTNKEKNFTFFLDDAVRSPRGATYMGVEAHNTRMPARK